MPNKENNLAVIFDMDGVLVNDIPYFRIAMDKFCKTHGIKMDDYIFNTIVNGRTSQESMVKLFPKKPSQKLIKKYIIEKDKMFWELYRPNLKPLPGLLNFLSDLKTNGVKMAVATSAPLKGAETILKSIKVKKYFSVIITERDVTLSKPDPQIYQLTANKLKTKPTNCVVFEDSLSGVISAQRAGMKVVGVTTTHTKKQLDGVNLAIKDFTKITFKTLTKLF